MERRLVAVGAALVLVLAGLIPATALAAPPPSGATRQIPAGGTTSIRSTVQGVDGLQQPELRPGSAEADGGAVVNRPRPGFKNGKFPKHPARRADRAVEHGCQLEPRGGLQLRRTQPPRPAAGQRRQPVVPRAAGPGPVRRQRLHRRDRQQRHPRLLHHRRRSADGCRGSQHVLRLSGRDRPLDRGRGSERDRSAVLLRPGQPAVRGRHHDAPRRRGRQLQRQEHDRRRRLEHRRPDRRLDDLPRARPERRHRRDTRTTAARSTARRPARASRTTRTSVATRTASTSRPTSTTCSDRTSTRRRSSRSRRPSSPPTRPRSR